MSNPTPLGALASIISENVKILESNSKGLFPSLDSPDSAPIPATQSNIDATQLIIAAAAQLIASVRNPEDTIRDVAPAVYTTTALGYVVDIDIADILGEAGPQGLHVKDIASKSGADENHIGRILRYLATRHIFREVTPNVFANNRISATLKKNNGKTVKELQEDPQHKYDNAGTAAFIGHVSDEALKSTTSLIPFLKTSPKTVPSPFNLGHNTPHSLWEWFEQPGNDWRLRRFMAIMTKDGALFPDEIFVNALDWAKLTPTDVVVDVGGNLGTVTLTLAKTFDKPKFIVQDLGKVIGGAKPFWDNVFPEAITTGRVTLQEHDFFQPQPSDTSPPSVYFLRFILHDWPTSACLTILKHLRSHSTPSTKLILFEFCVPHACDSSPPSESIKESGSWRKPAPFPLLANWGSGQGTYPTFVDLQMMNLFDGQERTLEEFVDLGKESGWKLEEVKYERLATLVFSPA